MPKSKADRVRAINVELRWTATRAVVDRVVNLAHQQRVFSRSDVIGHDDADGFKRDALAQLLGRAVQAGALRPEGEERWAIVDEDSLCEVAYPQGSFRQAA